MHFICIQYNEWACGRENRGRKREKGRGDRLRNISLGEVNTSPVAVAAAGTPRAGYESKGAQLLFLPASFLQYSWEHCFILKEVHSTSFWALLLHSFTAVWGGFLCLHMVLFKFMQFAQLCTVTISSHNIPVCFLFFKLNWKSFSLYWTVYLFKLVKQSLIYAVNSVKLVGWIINQQVHWQFKAKQSKLTVLAMYV